MLKYSNLFGSGGAILGPTLATNFFKSRTWVAPQDGIVVLRAIGAGGGGGGATGGYSGSWGAKILRVKEGDTIDVVIGAGGTSAHFGGAAGGNTIITVGGVQYIAYGGPGGIPHPAVAPPDGPSPSSNWDFGAASVKPGWVVNGTTGGAGVDILAQGNNATTSDSVNCSGGGGTGGPSVGQTGGGAMPGGMSALGTSPAKPAITFDASQGEWGISFYRGSGGIGGTDNSAGGNGDDDGGNSSGNNARRGGNGGGGSGGGGIYGDNHGGIGGGGGGGGGLGGQGFAHLKFYADMGV